MTAGRHSPSRGQRIDHVTYAERQRLSPRDDLVAGLARCLAIQRADWVDRDQ